MAWRGARSDTHHHGPRGAPHLAPARTSGHSAQGRGASRHPADKEARVTLGELLIASAITLTLMGSVVGMTVPLQRLFDTQPEYGDMHQRLRGAVDALTGDLTGAASPVLPYRSGVRRHDPDEGVFYRPDVITLVPAGPDAGWASHTYYVKHDPATGDGQLMRYDGNE